MSKLALVKMTKNAEILNFFKKGLIGQVFEWEEFKVLVFTVANI